MKMPPWTDRVLKITFWVQRELQFPLSIQIPSASRVSWISFLRSRQLTVQWTLMPPVSQIFSARCQPQRKMPTLVPSSLPRTGTLCIDLHRKGDKKGLAISSGSSAPTL